MGILFEVLKDCETEISLTEYSIRDIDFISEADADLAYKFNNITRDIILRGVISADKMNEAPIPKLNDAGEPLLNKQGEETFELREVDSVRKLANWAIIPEYCDCYKDIEVKITNARGDLVKQDSFENFYVVDYTEKFDDDSGHGSFYILMREREIPLKGLNPEKKEQNQALPSIYDKGKNN